jgi:hypothetical protein
MAGDVKADGGEVIGNLNALSSSLRSNADRLLRDVQAIHSSMLARIDGFQTHHRSLVDGAPLARERHVDRAQAGQLPGPDPLASVDDVPGQILDVPEFIPPG